MEGALLVDGSGAFVEHVVLERERVFGIGKVIPGLDDLLPSGIEPFDSGVVRLGS